MSLHAAPTYIPLATERTKNVLKHMQLGCRYVIDLVNINDPDDRKEADAWVLMDEQGTHFRFNEGGRSGDVEWDFADQVHVIADTWPDAE